MVVEEKLSTYIVRLRKSKGLSETQMAEKLGIKRSTYRYRERNLFKNITESEALNFPVDGFFEAVCRELEAEPKETIRRALNNERGTNNLDATEEKKIVTSVEALLNTIVENRRKELQQFEALHSKITSMLE